MKKGYALFVVFVMTAVAMGATESLPSFVDYYEPYVSTVEPNVPGYSLPLDVNEITNFSSMQSFLDLQAIEEEICTNGFAIIERNLGWADPNGDDMVDAYELLENEQIPFFVTLDTFLHLYHIQFDETLREIEEREFVSDLNDLTDALLDAAQTHYDSLRGDLQEAAYRNILYLSVAKKLLSPDWSIPTFVQEVVVTELAQIEAHAGYDDSIVFIYAEDYSQYVPRGHYTRSESLQRYFKAMMWFGRMAFLLKGSADWGASGEALISTEAAKIQTLQALLLAHALDTVQVDERTGLEVWDRIYTVTAFYVGVADDLTPYDYLWALDEVFDWEWTYADLLLNDNLFAVKEALVSLPCPLIFGGTGNAEVVLPRTEERLNEILAETQGMRLMGQRFIPDSYMFQQLVYPQVFTYTGDPDNLPFTWGTTPTHEARCCPRGLDVMAVMGCKQALTLLIEDGDTDYLDFWSRFGELRSEFESLSPDEWNQNLYWSWLYALRSLVSDVPAGYPAFMQSAAWQQRNLHTALASWSQLRHDTILYAKQSYTPVDSAIPTPSEPGYIEPGLECLEQLWSLSRMTRLGLTAMDVLSDAATQRLENLEGLLSQSITIVGKQLEGESLSVDDIQVLYELPETLGTIVTGVEEQGLKTSLVADVHTYTAGGVVLEEATGKLDLIVVACPKADGSVYLAAGPVLSYYEFQHPMDDRLTDEAWRDLLTSEACPDRPSWYSERLSK